MVPYGRGGPCPEVQRRWGLVAERLMGALVVVELEIAGEALPGLAGAAIGVQIDLLVFDGAPEALGEDIVQGAALAIHADLDAALLQAPPVLRAGEVGALIAVPDGWTASGQGGIDGG